MEHDQFLFYREARQREAQRLDLARLQEKYDDYRAQVSNEWLLSRGSYITAALAGLGIAYLDLLSGLDATTMDAGSLAGMAVGAVLVKIGISYGRRYDRHVVALDVYNQELATRHDAIRAANF